eukprot:scaffold4545_cov58-Phaeocystis_antarctica.AAC.5
MEVARLLQGMLPLVLDASQRVVSELRSKPITNLLAQLPLNVFLVPIVNSTTAGRAVEHDTVRAHPGLRTNLQPRKVFEPIMRLVRDDGWRDRLVDRFEVHVIPIRGCEDGRARHEGAQKLSAQHIVEIVKGIQHHEIPPSVLLPPGSILKVVGNGVGAPVEGSHVAAPERTTWAILERLPGEPTVCSIGHRERAANHVQLCRVRIEHARRVALEALEQPPVDHLLVKGVDVRPEPGGFEQALDRVSEVVGIAVMEIEAGQVSHVEEGRPPGANMPPARIFGVLRELRSADLVVRKHVDLTALIVVGPGVIYHVVYQLLVGPRVSCVTRDLHWRAVAKVRHLRVRVGRVGLVGRRRGVEGARPAQPLGELGEALRRHVLRVHEEGTPRGALVLVQLEDEAGRLLDIPLDEAERRRRVPQRVACEVAEGAQDGARLRGRVAPQVQHDARAGEELLQKIDPLPLPARDLEMRELARERAIRLERAEIDELLEAEDLVRPAHGRSHEAPAASR